MSDSTTEEPESVWPSLGHRGRLVRDVDQVELKLVVSEYVQGDLMSVLGVDRHRARTRQLYLFDTPDMALARRRLIVRARRKKTGGGDFTIKLRRTSPVELTRKLRRSPNLDLEMDVLPGSAIWSAALTRRLDSSALKSVLAGRRPSLSLLSAEQRVFLRMFAGRDIKARALRGYGPIEITRTPAHIAGSPTKLVFECWTYPDGTRLQEVSTKCAPRYAGSVASATGRLLIERGVELTAPQRTKTEVAVDYFAGAVRDR